ncbi:hypothetical protein AX17_002510 [Amanita inopinata Kibby_2008]|nr:hypothetical protein AX17_002510 [Amanita inopinata Kibby_2008]
MTPSTPTVTPTATRVRMPRTLPRPALREVDMSIIEETFPELKGLTPQYIRDKLPITAPHMLAALRSLHTCIPSSSLPRELDVELGSVSQDIPIAPPTHMLAVVCPPSAGKTKVTLYPAHQLVFSANCANLPALPSPSVPSSSATSLRLPVVTFRLPVPAAFPLLYSYLYTKRSDVLLASLAPECENDLASVVRAAAIIQGLWQDTCVLGVVDPVLFDTIDLAWGRVVTALERAQSL